MKIEIILLGLALIFCGSGMGYVIGFRHCFNYLKSELEKFTKGEE